MPRQRPTIVVEPNMKPGDADKMVDLMESAGLRVLPWQRELMNRLEAASIPEKEQP